MTWLAIAALGVWLLFQQQALDAFRRRAERLEARLRGLEAERAAPSAPAPAATAVPITEALASPPQPSPTLADAASIPAAIETRERPPRPRINAAAWLSEHGLAWLGGGALALGGLFLAAYAAQRGMFTPGLRIAAAIAAGFIMVGAGEWMRRRMSERRRGPVPALLAGAGAATLYGAVWASDRLYGFIDISASAPLLGLISAGLLALAFVHGMRVALVALLGAYLAPVVTNGPDWGDGPLTAYLLLILLTGYTVAAVRGWREVAWASGAGATFWALANLGDADNVPAAVLLTSAPAAAIAADLWRRRIGWQALAGDPPPSAPLVALAASALASLSLWLPNNGLDPGAAAAGLGVALALLAAFAAIVRAAPAWVQPPVYITLATGALANWNGVGLAMAPDRAPAAAAVLFGLVVAGAGAAWAPRERIARLYAAIGPAVAALGLTVVVGIVRSTAFDLAWVLPTTAAALTGLVATGLGGRSEDARTDLALAIWIWSCALLATVAVTAGLAWQAKAIGVTVLTLVAAALHARLAWRGFGAAAIALAVTVLVVVAGVGARTLDGQAPAWAMALIFTVATLGLWGASRVSRAGGPRQPLSDALSTGALIAGVMGALFLLRLQGPGPAAGLEPLLEAGLGVVLLLAAGLLTARGRTEDAGWLGRWRAHLFLMAGVAYGVAGPLFVLNPFWADAGLPIKGPPIFDTLLLAYLAPAALLIPCVGRRISPVHGLSGLYAAASAIFALGWAALEIRRLFKGPAFAWGPEAFGRAEGCAYALLAFAAALALGWIARKFRERAAEPAPIVDDLRAGGEILEGLAAALAAVVFGFAANPWWGPITRPFSDHPAAILLLALHAVGVGAWLLMARLSARFGAVARVGAALQLFVLITLMVRYGFRGLDMHTAQSEARIETWAFSAIWALYGVAVLALGAFRKDMVLRWTGLVLLLATTAKVFLFDMARLDGMVRAASFLAVGALLIAAALAARRFGGLNLVKREAEEGA